MASITEISNDYRDLLCEVNASEAKTFDQIKNEKSSGVYLVSEPNSGAYIYIGKTGRSGKERLREMSSDYRSHSFNRKLLRDMIQGLVDKLYPQSLDLLKESGLLNDKLKIKRFGKEAKSDFIKSGVVKESFWLAAQNEVNIRIKQKLRFRFVPIEDSADITSFEHYCIGILRPLYND